MTDQTAGWRRNYVLGEDDINSIADHVASRDPRAIHIPNGSVASLIAMLRDAEAERDAMRELLGSIWLYVTWRYVTKQLTTEQKELWADAVDAKATQRQIKEGEEPRPVAERWWRDNFMNAGGGDD